MCFYVKICIYLKVRALVISIAIDIQEELKVKREHSYIFLLNDTTAKPENKSVFNL